MGAITINIDTWLAHWGDIDDDTMATITNIISALLGQPDAVTGRAHGSHHEVG